MFPWRAARTLCFLASGAHAMFLGERRARYVSWRAARRKPAVWETCARRRFVHGGLTPRRSPGLERRAARQVWRINMDRYWLLTNTCYGTWLPGDARGFVGHVWEHRPGEPEKDRRIEHVGPGTPYDEPMPGLEGAARARLSGSPIHLTVEHAEVLLAQFQET